jgi:hypothetical protein
VAQARQALIVRGLIPVLADPADSFSSMRELSGADFARYGGGMLGAVIHRAGGMGLVAAGDRVVVVQRLGDTAVVKILNYSGNAQARTHAAHCVAPRGTLGGVH